MHKVTLFLATLLVAVFADLAVTAQEGSFNWMREYVRLRVDAMNMKVLGSRVPKPDGQVYTPRIVGGTIAGADDNPFQVALLNKAVADNFQAQYCGGTLIKSDVVVTAAHCSDFAVAGQVQVLTGTRNLDGTGTRRDVLRIAVHPAWNSATYEMDVAVWTLSSDVQDLDFASIANIDGTVGESLLATGWGDTTPRGEYPIALRKVDVPLVSRTNCNDANSYGGAISENMLCAGFDEGGKDACQGDSGGPLTRGPNNTVLTGITSWGVGCGRPNLFGVYTRVSNESVRSFIVQASELD